jgi:hypothetical protein
VRGTTSGLRAKNGPSTKTHVGGKYFFWLSQTGCIARSLKTDRVVFRYDLTAAISNLNHSDYPYVLPNLTHDRLA